MEYFTIFEVQCKKCGCPNFLTEIEPSDSIHFVCLVCRLYSRTYYGSVECDDCKAWVRWLPNPAVSSKEIADCKQIIEATLASGQVSGWEYTFFSYIRERRYFTHKQREKFEQICQRH